MWDGLPSNIGQFRKVLQSVLVTISSRFIDRFRGTHPPNINEGTHLISMKGPWSDMEPLRMLLNEVLIETKQ
jgi:hypothetical protein